MAESTKHADKADKGADKALEHKVTFSKAKQLPPGYVEPPEGKLPNQWRATIKGNGQGDGTLPDEQVIRLGGSTDRNEIAMHAQWIANAQSRRAVAAGYPDPELKVVAVESIGYRAQTSPTGLPPDAKLKQIDLNRYVPEKRMPAPATN